MSTQGKPVTGAGRVPRIKHQFNQSGERFVRINEDAVTRNPTFTFRNDDDRPYWKNYGSGHTHFECSNEHGEIFIRTFNTPEGGKGGKETWVTMSKEHAAMLRDFLTAVLG